MGLVFDHAAPVLVVEHLSVTFPTDDGPLRAVDDVNFDVAAGETLGIVGESGSGKTVTALTVLGLLPRQARVFGSVRFRGVELLRRRDRELQPIRGARIAMVFQDALAALNPVHRVGDQLAEAIAVHGKHPRATIRERVVELLDLVGIPNPREHARRYPHEYSGGMRQRAMIAMAIANEPDILIADEPTTALDVTIQAQVLDVFQRIQARTDTAIVLITHDLGVVAGMSDRAMVMYAGRSVEVGTVDVVFDDPRHPYTRGLLASLPRLDRRRGEERLRRIRGQPPSLVSVPPGCAFHPRCPDARAGRCDRDRPELAEVSPGHTSACFFAAELPPKEQEAAS